MNLHAFAGNNPINRVDYLGWIAKYYVGRLSRSLAEFYIRVPRKIGIISLPESEQIEKLINNDAGHHNVAVWCEDDGKSGKKVVLGFFAEKFKNAAIGAAKEVVSTPFPVGLIKPEWRGASWVDGEYRLRPENDQGKVQEKFEITKAKYQRGKAKLQEFNKQFMHYSLLHFNCQMFAGRMIRRIK